MARQRKLRKTTRSARRTSRSGGTARKAGRGEQPRDVSAKTRRLARPSDTRSDRPPVDRLREADELERKNRGTDSNSLEDDPSEEEEARRPFWRTTEAMDEVDGGRGDRWAHSGRPRRRTPEELRRSGPSPRFRPEGRLSSLHSPP
jgi:hypothetical protein